MFIFGKERHDDWAQQNTFNNILEYKCLLSKLQRFISKVEL